MELINDLQDAFEDYLIYQSGKSVVVELPSGYVAYVDYDGEYFIQFVDLSDDNMLWEDEDGETDFVADSLEELVYIIKQHIKENGGSDYDS